MGALQVDIRRRQGSQLQELGEDRARLDAAVCLANVRTLADELEEILAQAPRLELTADWLDLLRLAEAALDESVDLAAQAAGLEGITKQ